MVFDWDLEWAKGMIRVVDIILLLLVLWGNGLSDDMFCSVNLFLFREVLSCELCWKCRSVGRDGWMGLSRWMNGIEDGVE